MTALYLDANRGQIPTLVLSGAFPSQVQEVTYLNQTSDFTVIAGEAHTVDSTLGPIVSTLPLNPVEGATVLIKVTNASNQVEIDPNGKAIANVTGNLIVGPDLVGKNLRLTYDSTTDVWTAVVN